MCEIRRGPEFCPIHRFDGMDQNLIDWSRHTGKSYLKKDCAFVSRKKIKNNENTNLIETPLFAG
jgi:hypothetical protein